MVFLSAVDAFSGLGCFAHYLCLCVSRRRSVVRPNLSDSADVRPTAYLYPPHTLEVSEVTISIAFDCFSSCKLTVWLPLVRLLVLALPSRTEQTISTSDT